MERGRSKIHVCFVGSQSPVHSKGIISGEGNFALIIGGVLEHCFLFRAHGSGHVFGVRENYIWVVIQLRVSSAVSGVFCVGVLAVRFPCNLFV